MQGRILVDLSGIHVSSEIRTKGQVFSIRSTEREGSFRSGACGGEFFPEKYKKLTKC